MRINVDDRIAAAVAGGALSVAAAASALALLRKRPRVMAACSALLGRPVAYRLHLHGTGIELAPWERNYVRECVIRKAPGDGIRIGPVPPRPGEGGSVIDSVIVTGAQGAGFRTGEAATFAGHPQPPGDEAAGACHYPPAACENGHKFPAVPYARIQDRAVLETMTPVRLTCPECGGTAFVAPGRYSVQDGEVVREELAREAGGSAG